MKRYLILFFLVLSACTPVATQTPASFFAPNSNPQTVEVIQTVTIPSTQVESVPATVEPSLAKAGELYFFLQPRKPGESIQLARVSGVCVFDVTKCPPLEIIQVPFAFNFTINALTWSSDGKYAAFAYSDQTNGTPAKLWRFDPATKSWISMAEFPYIDPPFWSQDGTKIAFRAQDGLGAESAYVINHDGTELKSVSTDLPADGRPYIMDGWYQDAAGPSIIMRSALATNSAGIYLVRASDEIAHPMFGTVLTKAQFIAAPDASLLAYDESDYNTQSHTLKVIEPKGVNAITLANSTGGNLYPIVWSPNSQLVAFNFSRFSDGTPSAEVFIVGRDGSRLTSIYKGTTVGHLLFSPDGKYLLVEEITSTTGGHLFLVNLSTLEQKILQAPGLSTDYDWYAPSWRP